MSRTILQIGIAGALAALSAAAGEQPEAGSGDLVLATGSFWRCHLTLRNPAAGSGPEAKSWMPGRGNSKLH